jgi:hypothetical protein
MVLSVPVAVLDELEFCPAQRDVAGHSGYTEVESSTYFDGECMD